MMRCCLSLLVLFSVPGALAQERPAGFVDAAGVVPGLVVEMRYAGPHNFVGAPIDGYDKPVCLLTAPAAAALGEVARDLATRGLTLKVFDCYRPARAVAHFVRWARALGDATTKAEFYPDVDKRNLFRDGYISARSGHSRGSTVDITLVHRDDGRELDMVAMMAHACVNRSLKLAPASIVVPYQYTTIVWAVLFGYWVFGDVPEAAMLLGAAIIIAAGLFIALRERALVRQEPAFSEPPP